MEENRKTKVTEKKVYKKAKHTQHKYETRYAAAQGDEPVQLSAKEYEAMERRVKKLEERIKEREREKGRLTEDLAKVEVLTHQIEVLGGTFEGFHTNQVRINLEAHQSISQLHAQVKGFDPKFGEVTQQVAVLNARYQPLYMIASNLVSQQIAAAHLNPAAPAVFPLNPNFRPTFLPSPNAPLVRSAPVIPNPLQVLYPTRKSVAI